MDNELVLVADGDKRIRNLINITLQAHDYKCITANGGESALLLASSNNPAAVLLELNLPDMDGTEVIRKIRSWSDVPIVVVSSRMELLARLRVMGRRYAHYNEAPGSSSVFYNGGLRIDYASNCVYVNDTEVHLTPIEYKILCMLSHNCGKVLTHTDITKEIWGNSWESTITTLRTFMASLRRKIQTDSQHEYIHTHTSVGYRMLQI